MEDINRIKVVLVEKKRTNKCMSQHFRLGAAMVISDALIQFIHP